jgi:lipoate-protein ligase A
MNAPARATWRLIQTPPAPGAWNMAVDEALLLGMGAPGALPVLRLYAWEPACLSLGYAQPYQDVDVEALKRHGWNLVRRPTGGRAILHTDELTYAVIGPPDEPRLAGGVLESYQRLSQALLQALLDLGLPVQSQAQAGAAPNNLPKGPVCFEVPSNYEITVNGKKLVGSAQARRKEGVLQHGSLPLYGDLRRITQALCFPSPEARQEAAGRLLQRATTAEACLGQLLAWEVAAQAFRDAFAACLDLELAPSALSSAELERAEQLAESKYRADSWNQRV